VHRIDFGAAVIIPGDKGRQIGGATMVQPWRHWATSKFRLVGYVGDGNAHHLPGTPAELSIPRVMAVFVLRTVFFGPLAAEIGGFFARQPGPVCTTCAYRDPNGVSMSVLFNGEWACVRHFFDLIQWIDYGDRHVYRRQNRM